MPNDLRRWMMLCEGTVDKLAALTNQKTQLLSSLVGSMDTSSVKTILQEFDDVDDDELASIWFDNCMRLYQRAAQQTNVSIYRHMMVEDFKSFIASLKAGQGTVGEYWSLSHSVESPTWPQDQKGTIPVVILGRINKNQVDWEASLRQNFEYPEEYEIIFNGEVFVQSIENEDTGRMVRINKRCRK